MKDFNLSFYLSPSNAATTTCRCVPSSVQTGYQMSRGKTKKFRSEKKCMLTLTLQDAKPA